MPITDELIQLETSGIEVYKGPIICIICDNPQASEICSHFGQFSKKVLLNVLSECEA